MTAGLTLFFYWLCLAWLRRVRPDASLKVKVATLLVITPLIIYPFTYGPLWWLRGLTGDLSIVSTVLLLLAVIRMVWNKTWISPQENRLLLRAVAGLGLLFYPLALGVGNLDPYVWGYTNNPYMFSVLLGLSLLAFSHGFYAIATIMLVVVLSWNIQLLESVNLWDYLLDPFIFFYALAKVIRRTC